MTRRLTNFKQERGFTIVEVLVAIFVLLLGVLATVTLLNTANASTERNQSRNGATNLVRDIVEASRALPYDQTTPTRDSSGNPDTTFASALQNMSPTSTGAGFDDSEPTIAGWQITRRNVVYTITLAACVVDDPKDRVAASHSPAQGDSSGYFCPNLATTPVTDGNPDDYRRIKVTASWTSSSCNSCGATQNSPGPKTFSVAQTGLIVNPTGGLGPSPRGPISNGTQACFVTQPYTATFDRTAQGAVFTVNDPNSTQVTVTTPTSVDGTTGDKTYTFNYAPSPFPADNTYTVEAQAFNSASQFGRVVVGRVYVNCSEPANPATPEGGFNWRRCVAYPATCTPGERIFDLEWAPNGEADVVGYYVFAVNGQEDWKLIGGDPPDTKVACVSKASATTTDHPGPLDFLESFQPACWDANVSGQPSLGSVAGLIFFPGTEGKYWIQAIDPDPADLTGATLRPTLTNHSPMFTETENMLNVRATPPILTVQNVGDQACLSWTDSTDVDALGANIVSPVRYYRIYRDDSNVPLVDIDPGGGVVNVNDVPYADRIGRSLPNQSGSCDTTNPARSYFLDTSAGSTNWNYWVTAVDQDYLESYPSNTGVWTP